MNNNYELRELRELKLKIGSGIRNSEPGTQTWFLH